MAKDLYTGIPLTKAIRQSTHKIPKDMDVNYEGTVKTRVISSVFALSNEKNGVVRL
jgi:hypothetical protein